MNEWGHGVVREGREEAPELSEGVMLVTRCPIALLF